MEKEQSSSSGAMPFLEHLEELRWRIIKALIAVVVCGGGVYAFWKWIFENILAYPLHKFEPKPQLIFTGPSEAFMASIKIALFGGLFLASPFVLYQIWRFVAPGLFKRERRHALLMVFLSALCFLLGIGFSFLATPHTLRFLSNFRTESLSPYFAVNSYLGFILKLTLAFGVVFQLPAASFVLTRVGMITHRTLLDFWRMAVVVVFVMAAFITPPDIISQSMMAVPLLVLYFISVGIARISGRKEALPAPATEHEEE